MSRYLQLLFLLSFLFTAACKQNESQSNVEPSKVNTDSSYSFFVAGHTYGNPTDFQIGLHPPFVNAIPYLNEYPGLRLGVLTGDVVAKDTPEFWNAAQSTINKLNVPIHIAPGNHDRGEEFEKRFRNYYEAFFVQEDLFIILSPTEWNIDRKQLSFLRASLRANPHKTNNIFIFCHELIWWDPDNKFGQVEINYRPHYPGKTNYWSDIHPLLDSLPNTVTLFAGDVGATSIVTPYMYYNEDNITLIASGMGGGIEDNIIIVDRESDGSFDFKLIGLNMEQPAEIGKLKAYQLPTLSVAK